MSGDPRARQRARTRSAILEAASELVRAGSVPSVPEAAEAAGVSRATAYRYFSTQAELLEAVMEETMIDLALEEDLSEISKPEELVEYLVERALPLIRERETEFRATLRLSLEQWERRDGDDVAGAATRLAGRIGLIETGLAQLEEDVGATVLPRVAIALSILFGIEAYIVCRDIWGLTHEETTELVRWAALTLLRGASG